MPAGKAPTTESSLRSGAAVTGSIVHPNSEPEGPCRHEKRRRLAPGGHDNLIQGDGIGSFIREEG
ncbi:MAG TPA: hypothetical protein VN713_02735, partial [Sphingomicrobium sp.]|nr:hypothetical protein [Sphingomicrobium sp.]